MKNNPDSYLLYEYMNKLPFTVRMKACPDEGIDEKILTKAAQEAIGRFPYFAVKVGFDEGQNYTLEHNDKPIAVLPEKNERLFPLMNRYHAIPGEIPIWHLEGYSRIYSILLPKTVTTIR